MPNRVQGEVRLQDAGEHQLWIASRRLVGEGRRVPAERHQLLDRLVQEVNGLLAPGEDRAAPAVGECVRHCASSCKAESLYGNGFFSETSSSAPPWRRCCGDHEVAFPERSSRSVTAAQGWKAMKIGASTMTLVEVLTPIDAARLRRAHQRVEAGGMHGKIVVSDEPISPIPSR